MPISYHFFSRIFTNPESRSIRNTVVLVWASPSVGVWSFSWAEKSRRRARRVKDLSSQSGCRRTRRPRLRQPERRSMVRILYVEDNDDNIYMLQTRLERQGFDVLIARD